MLNGLGSWLGALFFKWIEEFWRDVRFGSRMLMKHPGFTFTAVIILAIGIGANVAIFSLADVVLFKLLPVKDPQQLVFVQRVQQLDNGREYDDMPLPIFEQFRDFNHSFSSMSAYSHAHVSVRVGDHSEMIRGDFVSGNYFEVLGVTPILGRAFTKEDDRPGGQFVALISYNYWERRFSRASSAVGETIYLGSIPVTVIGVTPRGFFGVNVAGNSYSIGVAGSSADITLPLFMQSHIASKDFDSFSTITPEYSRRVIARMKPGVSPVQALAELDAIYQQARGLESGPGVFVSPRAVARAARIEMNPALRGESELGSEKVRQLRILAAVVGIVLLIASVNVAGLLLARAPERQRDIALHTALGASRARLIRQLLTESILLGMLGGALGLLLARWSTAGLVTILSSSLELDKIDVDLDIRLLAFSGAVSLLTAILFGLAPAVSATRGDLSLVLKGTEGTASFRPKRNLFVKSLAVTQVALSLVLLIGAGLLVRTLQQLYKIDTGFERDKVMTMWIYPGLAGYNRTREIALYRELLERINAIPGVQSASLSMFPLYRGTMVGPRFFETEGIPLLQGREFSPSDTETSPKVAIFSEAMARKLFPNENPVGQRFSWQLGGAPSRLKTGDVEIIGVVKDIVPAVAYWWNPTKNAVWYLPYTQAPPMLLGRAQFLVRTTGSLSSIVPMIRKTVQSVDKDLALVDIKTQAEEFNDNMFGRERAMATLLGFFGVLALGLAALGIYGTLAYAVARRTKEFGIRMALGAPHKEVLRMVLHETLSVVAMGIVLGILSAMAATKLIASMLFGVKTTDPIIISISILVIFAVALLASFIPARRAIKVDPVVALRQE